jgi:hypothetical protein
MMTSKSALSRLGNSILGARLFDAFDVGASLADARRGVFNPAHKKRRAVASAAPTSGKVIR